MADGVPGVLLVPAAVQDLGDLAELHQEIAGEVLRLNVAALFPPKAEQGVLVVAHDDTGVGTANEGAAVRR
jgi:hypothetical protein